MFCAQILVLGELVAPALLELRAENTLLLEDEIRLHQLSELHEWQLADHALVVSLNESLIDLSVTKEPLPNTNRQLHLGNGLLHLQQNHSSACLQMLVQDLDDQYDLGQSHPMDLATLPDNLICKVDIVFFTFLLLQLLVYKHIFFLLLLFLQYLLALLLDSELSLLGRQLFNNNFFD